MAGCDPGTRVRWPGSRQPRVLSESPARGATRPRANGRRLKNERTSDGRGGGGSGGWARTGARSVCAPRAASAPTQMARPHSRRRGSGWALVEAAGQVWAGPNQLRSNPQAAARNRRRLISPSPRNGPAKCLASSRSRSSLAHKRCHLSCSCTCDGLLHLEEWKQNERRVVRFRVSDFVKID
jgi:hypothetical protein